jgi:hypothetical protein
LNILSERARVLEITKSLPKECGLIGARARTQGDESRDHIIRLYPQFSALFPEQSRNNLFGFALLCWDNRDLGDRPTDRYQAHGERHETTHCIVVRPAHIPSRQ